MENVDFDLAKYNYNKLQVIRGTKGHTKIREFKNRNFNAKIGLTMK